MKIAVNTHLLVKGKLDGIGLFSFATLSRIAKNHPEHDFYFIFDRPYNEEYIFSDNVHPIILYPPARHPLLWFIRFQLRLPKLLKKIGADIFLSPDGWVSLYTKVPTVSVLHDLNFYHYPKNLPFLVRTYYNYFFPKGAKLSKRLCTVSEYSKTDIVKSFNIPAEKIDVVYSSSNVPMQHISEDQGNKIKTQFTDGVDYFIFVGTLMPRKNIGNLMLAFDQFKKKYTKPFKMVFAGAKKWWPDEYEQIYQSLQFKDDLIFTGRLNTVDMHNLIAASYAVTYVSLFEGFGVPIIEAMYCSTAVITSNTTSMPEIAGDAALLCDPNNPEDIANAMYTLATDKQLREKLIEKGKERRLVFSWDNTADLLWKSIEKVL